MLKDGRTQTIQPITKARYLGVILDNKLVGKVHLDYITERSISQLACLSGIAGSTWGIITEYMCQLYMATVMPCMLYAASCWYIPEGGCSFINRTKKVH